MSELIDDAPAPSKKAILYPGLDGLRAVAMATIFVGHSMPGVGPGAGVSVEVFFVLSGFLITNILLRDHAATGGGTSFRSFYLRRAKRLLPALITVMAGCWIIYTLDSDLTHTGDSLISALGIFFYFGNWLEANKESTLSLLSHTWTLSVEEQFYAVWPLLFFLFGRRNRLRPLLFVTLGLAAASAVLRAVMWAGSHDVGVYYRSDTRASGLMIGCSLALIFADPGLRKLLRPARSVVLAVLALGFLGFWALFMPTHGDSVFYGGYVLGSLAAAVLVLHLVVADSWFTRLFSIGWLTWLGKRSYGLYLWHAPVIFTMQQNGFGIDSASSNVNSLIVCVCAAPITVALAALSYRFIEEPFLKQGPKNHRLPDGQQRPVTA